MYSVCVSGSFHRHMDAISSAVTEFLERGVRVLSPADPRVVDQDGDFYFVASDRVRSIRLVQDRHLEAIQSADFLWLVSPDGYVGQSASMEIGYAVAAGTPILGLQMPQDLTLRQYISVVPSLDAGLCQVASSHKPKAREGFLINPHDSVERAHETLDRIGSQMARKVTDSSGVYLDLKNLHRDLQLPFSIQ